MIQKEENIRTTLNEKAKKLDADAKEYCKAKGKSLKIELEVRNFDELNQALAEGVDRIMFDNFTPVSYTHLDVYKRQE